MSRVIKNNDGVAIVEGTPASSLIKEGEKFFASKPPERMAGESIFQPRKIDPRAINTRSPIQRRPDPKAINTRSPIRSKPQSERTDEERAANLEAFDRLSEEKKREMTVNTKRPVPEPKDSVARENQMEEKKPIVRGLVERGDLVVNPRGNRKPYERHGRPAGGNPNRNKAKEKAESRRERFFQRRRSRKEAVRSQREQEATQGKFITTLGR